LNISATTFSSLPLPRPKSCGGSPARQGRATEPSGSGDGAAGPCRPAHRGHLAPRGPPPRGPLHRRRCAPYSMHQHVDRMEHGGSQRGGRHAPPVLAPPTHHAVAGRRRSLSGLGGGFG
jgi:hypothetical protein